MRLEKLYVSKDYVCIKFVVRDEVGGIAEKEKALREGKRWHEYVVEVREGKVKIEFRWITWGKMRKEEVYNFLRSFGANWDYEETGGIFRRVRYLYKNGERIGTVEEVWD